MRKRRSGRLNLSEIGVEFLERKSVATKKNLTFFIHFSLVVNDFSKYSAVGRVGAMDNRLLRTLNGLFLYHFLNDFRRDAE